MKHIFKIRSLLAAAMLLFFAYSITPQIILHNAFSHHHHRQIFADGAHKVFSTTGPNCSFDNTFTASIFTVPYVADDLIVPAFFPDHSYFTPGDCNHQRASRIHLRGPPSLV